MILMLANCFYSVTDLGFVFIDIWLIRGPGHAEAEHHDCEYGDGKMAQLITGRSQSSEDVVLLVKMDSYNSNILTSSVKME